MLNTATLFLQGLYPPLVDLNSQVATQTLNNGFKSEAPLNGYQYQITLYGVVVNAPDTIWIKGNDSWPIVIEASDSFEDSAEFSPRMASTRDLRRFFPMLESVYDCKSADIMSYAKAFEIFDLVNVSCIHNATSLSRNVTDKELLQLRTLSDGAEFGYNYSFTQPSRSIDAETFSGAILSQLNKSITSKGRLNFSLLAVLLLCPAILLPRFPNGGRLYLQHAYPVQDNPKKFRIIPLRIPVSLASGIVSLTARSLYSSRPHLQLPSLAVLFFERLVEVFVGQVVWRGVVQAQDVPGKHTRLLYDHLSQKEAGVLAQLGTGMARLNGHLDRIGAAPSDQCACGKVTGTVDCIVLYLQEPQFTACH